MVIDVLLAWVALSIPVTLIGGPAIARSARRQGGKHSGWSPKPARLIDTDELWAEPLHPGPEPCQPTASAWHRNPG